MIERFNFYDVYGYFLPGIALLALVWLPFGFARHLWPANALSAIVALAFAYILGHVLQSFASNVFPSKGKDSKSKKRYPSNFFLDPEDATFPKEFKGELQRAVADSFKLDLAVEKYGGDGDEIDRSRRTAFLLCRGLLVREDVVSYGEQFEGLYALMRGLATSFWLSSAYFGGWALSVWQNACFGGLIRVGTFFTLVLATVSSSILALASTQYKRRFAVDVITFGALTLSFFCLGALLGSHYALTFGQAQVVAIIAIAALFAGFRCFRGYKYYAEQFAQAIWRDFAGLQLEPSSKHDDGSESVGSDSPKSLSPAG